MSATDLFQMEAAMKVIFEDSVFENYVTDSEFMDQFEQDSNIMQEETTGGRYIETAQYFNLPAGVRSVATNDYIPVPNGPVVKNARIYLKKIQGTVEMTGDTMRRVRTNEGAFLNWAERALPDLVSRLVNTTDRMGIGFGSGVLGRTVGAVTGDGDETPFSVVVNRAYGVGARRITVSTVGVVPGILRMAEMPEQFRLAVLLADVEGFSYKEIAEILDVPIGTVMSRLHRGRRALEKRLWDVMRERGVVR
jgi:hypothetical protein